MKQYIVDAFTDKIFSGNPAAVCVLDNFPSEDIMQSIAAENITLGRVDNLLYVTRMELDELMPIGFYNCENRHLHNPQI